MKYRIESYQINKDMPIINSKVDLIKNGQGKNEHIV